MKICAGAHVIVASDQYPYFASAHGSRKARADADTIFTITANFKLHHYRDDRTFDNSPQFTIVFSHALDNAVNLNPCDFAIQP